MHDEKQLVKALGGRFIQRKDAKAMQQPDGSWFPVRDGKDGPLMPFTMQDFRDHLEGRKTFGHYLVDLDGNCKFFAFDIDIRKYNPKDENPTGWYSVCCDDPECGHDGKAPEFFNKADMRPIWLDDNPATDAARTELRIQLRCMAEGLARAIHRRLEIPVAVVDSGGKGLHVYGFTGTRPAEVAQQLAVGILEGFGRFEAFRGKNFWRHKDAYNNLDIEIFPKQASLDGKEFGNLMKLPLGVHRKTGRRSYFCSLRSGYDMPWSELDPMRALEGDLPWE